MFAHLKKDKEVAEETDVIYSPTFESGVFDFVIDSAYVDTSAGGATKLALSLVSVDGKTLKQDFWVASGDEKGNKNWYLDKKDNKQYLPGFLAANGIHELITGKELGDATPEEKLVKVYNPDTSKEEPQKKPVLTALLQKTIKLAVRQHRVFKQVKSNGTYVDTNEVRMINEIEKAFDAETGKTLSEKTAGGEAEFLPKWLKSFEGKILDKTAGKNPASTANFAGGNTAAGGEKKTEMFT